jgi:hypothetical protein
MYDDSQITMQETTLLGHIGGNLVMRDRSQGLLVSNTISVRPNASSFVSPRCVYADFHTLARAPVVCVCT